MFSRLIRHFWGIQDEYRVKGYIGEPEQPCPHSPNTHQKQLSWLSEVHGNTNKKNTVLFGAGCSSGDLRFLASCKL
eukprot:3461075-Amphidinium_carterae.1